MARGVRAVVWINLFYVYILDRIWILKHARNNSGLLLHLDKCHAKGYIDDIERFNRLHYNFYAFASKSLIQSNYESMRCNMRHQCDIMPAEMRYKSAGFPAVPHYLQP